MRKIPLIKDALESYYLFHQIINESTSNGNKILLVCANPTWLSFKKATVLTRRYFLPFDLVFKVELGLEKEALCRHSKKNLPTSVLSSDNEIFQIRKPIPVWEKKTTELVHYIHFLRHCAFSYSRLVPGPCKPVQVLHLALDQIGRAHV